MAYDLIVTDKEIDQTIGKIVRLRINMSENAQAAAMSKAVIQLIDNFDKSLLAVNSQLPPMAAMWDTEQTKVRQVINAINAGAKPQHKLSIWWRCPPLQPVGTLYRTSASSFHN